MHEDTARGWPPARSGRVTIDVGREGVVVTAPGGEHRRVSVEEHRADVVRRLLEAGLTPQLLTALLPQFRPLIEALSSS